MDWKLELIVLPVTDVDRAKAFYEEQLRFRLDVDHRAGEDFRIVQLTPPGSACSVTLMRQPDRAGAVQALHLVVADIEAAREHLVENKVDVSEPFTSERRGRRPASTPTAPTTAHSSPSATRTATAGWSRRSGVRCGEPGE